MMAFKKQHFTTITVRTDSSNNNQWTLKLEREDNAEQEMYKGSNYFPTKYSLYSRETLQAKTILTK